MTVTTARLPQCNASPSRCRRSGIIGPFSSPRPSLFIPRCAHPRGIKVSLAAEDAIRSEHDRGREAQRDEHVGGKGPRRVEE